MLNECRQLLIATAPLLDLFQGMMTPFSCSEQGVWHKVGEPFFVVFGERGMAFDEETLSIWNPDGKPPLKREGDLRSPIGCFPLLSAFGNASNPSTRMPYNPICGLEGIDDPSSQYYNRLVRREDICDVDWKSSEKMEENQEVYARGLVMGYNWKNPKPQAGSCIFVHIWRSFQEGTKGCTAMERKEMEKILAWLDPTQHPHILQCPWDVYEELREEAALPILRIP